MVRNMVTEIEKTLRNEWRTDKMGFHRFKDWLKYTKHDELYIPLERDSPLWTDPSTRPNPIFEVDVAGSQISGNLKRPLKELDPELHRRINEDLTSSPDMEFILDRPREEALPSSPCMAYKEGGTPEPDLPPAFRMDNRAVSAEVDPNVGENTENEDRESERGPHLSEDTVASEGDQIWGRPRVLFGGVRADEAAVTRWQV